MGIYDKLEEIRKKPEHIRMRYVWGMVAVSMALVLAIWVISLKSGPKPETSSIESLNTAQITEQFNQGKESLQNATEGFQSILEQQTTENSGQ